MPGYALKLFPSILAKRIQDTSTKHFCGRPFASVVCCHWSPQLFFSPQRGKGNKSEEDFVLWNQSQTWKYNTSKWVYRTLRHPNYSWQKSFNPPKIENLQCLQGWPVTTPINLINGLKLKNGHIKQPRDIQRVFFSAFGATPFEQRENIKNGRLEQQT